MRPELALASDRGVKAIRKLSNSEYKEFKKATMCLLRFSSDQRIFLIARLNYDSFNNLLKRYFEAYTKNPSMGWPRAEKMILEINRHLLNYLSAVRTFLDHSETNIKRRYGRNSERVKRFKRVCSKEYKNSFSYRFIYNLRNYAQHCGMPLGQLTLKSEEVDPHSKEVIHSLSIKFNRDELLSEYDSWGSQLKREIQRLPKTFEINPHISEMMKCIEMITTSLIEEEMPELIKSASYVLRLITETKGMPGVPCIIKPKILARSKEGKAERLELNIEWIPLHLVEMISRIGKIRKV
jgi:hypothetical protein